MSSAARHRLLTAALVVGGLVLLAGAVGLWVRHGLAVVLAGGVGLC